MKKYLVVLLVAGVLCGCAAEPTFETVDDTQIVSAVAPVRTVQMDFPPEAATPVMESAEGGALYQCDGYVLTVQTLSGGDLDRTLRQLTGYGQEHLRPVKTKFSNGLRYDMSWVSAGESGEEVGRCVLLDDGQNHYAVSVMADASRAGDLHKTWKALLNSVTLHTD